MTDQIWIIRAGEAARFASEFLSNGLIAIGFQEVAADNLTSVVEDDLRARATDPSTRNAVGQLATFRWRMTTGDLVILPRGRKHADYVVGQVTGDYRFTPGTPFGPHERPVKWLGTFPRTDLSQGAVNTLGAILTLFRPTAVEAELRTLITRLTPLSDDGGTHPTPTPSPQPGPVQPSPVVPSPSPDLSQRTPLNLPPLRFDVDTDSQGRCRIECGHPALVMEQVPRSVDPSSDWKGVPGIYVLTGTDLQQSSLRTGVERTITTTLIVRPWAYVGLSEDFLGRLSSHRQSKPEWRRALLVRSAAQAFTSDDIKYLELRVHELLAGTEEVLMPQSTPRGNLSARPKNPVLLEACAEAVVSVLRLTGILI